jgi:hypothetical protein
MHSLFPGEVRPSSALSHSGGGDAKEDSDFYGPSRVILATQPREALSRLAGRRRLAKVEKELSPYDRTLT